jgi:hypothetical protein
MRFCIALSVSVDLCDPVFPVCSRHPRPSLASVTVPETPVHEDRHTVPWKTEIRLARENGIMKSVPEAFGVSPPPYVQLRASIL